MVHNVWSLYMYLFACAESKERELEGSRLGKGTEKDLFRGKRNLILNPNMENEALIALCEERRKCHLH